MKLKEFLNHNRYQVVSTFLVAMILIWTYSCTSRVASIVNPSQRVNRQELQLEIDQFIALAEIRFADLQQQDELRQTLYKHTTLWAVSGSINPIGVLMSVGTLLGLGAVTDNVRTKIKNKKPPPV